MRTSSSIRGVLALAAVTVGGVWLGMGGAAAAVPGGDDPLASQESSSTAPAVSGPLTPSSTAPVAGDPLTSKDPSITAPAVTDPPADLQVPSVTTQDPSKDLITDIQHIGTNLPDAPAPAADPAPGVDSTPGLPGLPVDDPGTPAVPGAETASVTPSAVSPQDAPSLGDVAVVAPADAAHQPEAAAKDDKASLPGNAAEPQENVTEPQENAAESQENAAEPQKDDEAVSADLQKIPSVDATPTIPAV
ncbi:hypothetical protein AB0B89_18390 [Sphaerisporangium sp. NPDC049002]|uniref:hypothetical protein n=1 Tax=unclassified Sphaerisporangium TaxID=2630420 RepID=UPI0033BFB98E